MKAFQFSLFPTSILFSLVVLGLSAQPAAAITIPPSGSIVFEPNPLPGSSDTEIFAFAENQNIAFVASQSLDSGFSIAAGTRVNSYYIQFDPVEASSRVDSGRGTVTFDYAIIGVISNTNGLTRDLTEVGMTADEYFGLALNYSMGTSPENRGTGGPGDSFSVSGNTLTIQNLRIPGSDAGSIDAIRVLTAVPEPGTGLLLGSGLMLLSWRNRRRPTRR